jgi:hypothetical protein
MAEWSISFSDLLLESEYVEPGFTSDLTLVGALCRAVSCLLDVVDDTQIRALVRDKRNQQHMVLPTT